MPDPTESHNRDPVRTILALATLPPYRPDGTDRVLTDIAEAARIRREAEQRLRYLIAYAREFVQPRPYTLADLARAAGLSISGIRTTYGPTEIAAIATVLHRPCPPANQVARTGYSPPSREPPP